MAVKTGDRVKVEYEGSFEDGVVFDSSRHGDHSHPLEFVVGEHQVIAGFEDALMGMNIGDKKEIVIEPSEAYGEINENAFREFPRESIPQEHEVKEGGVLMVSTPDGNQFPVKVVKVDDKTIKVDFNHPLAGKKLKFKIELVDINGPPSEEHHH